VNDHRTEFATLFAGRTDAIFDSHQTKCERRQVTLGDYHQHLEGTREFGIYPVSEQGTCSWGCFDIDEENFPLADTVLQALNHVGLTGWIERSRSKGYHVWVFSEPVPSLNMYRAMRTINHGLGDLVPEVNPKSPSVDHIGNCVRLPYSGSATPGRMVMLDDEMHEVAVEDFTETAFTQRNTRETIQKVSMRLPLTHRLYPSETRTGPMGNGRGVNGDIHLVYAGRLHIPAGTKGRGYGRDETFYCLAKYCQARGMSENETRSRVQLIWDTMTEQPAGDIFPLRSAFEKVDRVYKRKNQWK
jgi:hypothetical protein